MDDISKWDIWEVIRFKWEQEGGVISGLLERHLKELDVFSTMWGNTRCSFAIQEGRPHQEPNLLAS
jgi:hypothetical protein